VPGAAGVDALTPATEATPPPSADPSPWPWGDQVRSLDEVEATYLRWCAAQPHLERKALAEQLGISERTLYRKLSALDRTGGD